MCVERISDLEKSELDLSSLRFLMSGAEPIRIKTIERFTECFQAVGFKKEMFLPSYGLAESTLLVTNVTVRKGVNSQLVDKQALNTGKVVFVEQSTDNARNIINCGKAASGIDVKIMNTETLKQCAAREIGEIWVNGESTAKGYWKLKPITAFTNKLIYALAI